MQICLDCKTESSLKWYNGPTCRRCYKKNRYRKNPEKQKALSKLHYKNNKETEKQNRKTRYWSDPEKARQKLKEYGKKWRQKNPEKVKLKYKKDYLSGGKYLKFKIKKQQDLQFKLKAILRTRLNNAIKRNTKSGSAVRDLGCTISELKQHLESKFQPGMTWENHGDWHIDHIKPLAKFDLSNLEQFKEACHYTNLQPLWAADNLSKGDRCN